MTDLEYKIKNLKIAVTCILTESWGKETSLTDIIKAIDNIFPEEYLRGSERTNMTGRDFIMFILENHLEEEDVLNFMFNSDAFMSISKAAEKFNVGTATIRAWVEYGCLKAYVINGELRIPTNAKVQGGMSK